MDPDSHSPDLRLSEELLLQRALCTVPSGILSLDEIGATDASVFYDDLLIASPARSGFAGSLTCAQLQATPQLQFLMGITRSAS